MPGAPSPCTGSIHSDSMNTFSLLAWSAAALLITRLARTDGEPRTWWTLGVVLALGLANLEGSLVAALPGIPDRKGPLDSALVVYDTGSFDIFDPAHVPFIPPLANVIPSGVCDPHSARPGIPASIDQVTNFLQPGGQVVNFCVGLCDGVQAEGETGGGNPACDPLSP